MAVRLGHALGSRHADLALLLVYTSTQLTWSTHGRRAANCLKSERNGGRRRRRWRTMRRRRRPRHTRLGLEESAPLAPSSRRGARYFPRDKRRRNPHQPGTTTKPLRNTYVSQL
ncbi:hypothetical protein PVAP13_6KG397750 [Panicum virgatum]|uniref:Uncharacterized protein n=1 Tax=Panicum virgatum TaxID=38727 RepID=A0A8T0RKR8_PANVG|nr:hypothetical protein PVAP13_6KG397750 [Panicum virgatum]